MKVQYHCLRDPPVDLGSPLAWIYLARSSCFNHDNMPNQLASVRTAIEVGITVRQPPGPAVKRKHKWEEVTAMWAIPAM